MKSQSSLSLYKKFFQGFWRKPTFWCYAIICAAAIVFAGLYLVLGARGYFVGGDDALFHISRYFSVLRGWADGQIVPQTDPTFLSGLGHSWNIFYGPLPAYLVAVLAKIFTSWQLAIALVMFGAVFFAGIVAFRFFRDVFSNLKWGRWAATIGAVVYIWSPYLIIDFYGRAAVGEVFAFIFLPLVFHGLWRMVNTKNHYIALLATGMTGLVLTHFLSVLIALLFGGLYLIININKFIPNWRKAASGLLLAIGITFGLSAFFTLPFVENMGLGIYAINNDWFSQNIMYFNAESVNNNRLDIINPWLGTRNYGFYLCVFLAMAAALLAICLRPREKVKNDIKVYLGLLVLAVFLTSTLIDWRLLPDSFYTIQFPTRFMGVASLFVAVAAGYGVGFFVAKIKSRTLALATAAVYLALLVASGLTRIPWEVDRNLNADNLSTTTNTGLNEYYTMGFLKDGFSTELANSGWKYIVHGNLEIEDFEFNPNSSERRFQASASTESVIELAQVYYVGFQATDDNGYELETTYSDNGLVKITIPAGFSGVVKSKFYNSQITILGFFITIITALGVVGCKIKSAVSHKI
jgi:hypothetical protein